MDLYFLPQPSRPAPSPPSPSTPFLQQDESSSSIPNRYSLVIPPPRKRLLRWIKPVDPAASGLWTVPEEVGAEGWSSCEREEFEEIDLEERTKTWQIRAAQSSFFEDDNDDEEEEEEAEGVEGGEPVEGDNNEGSSSLDDFRPESFLDDLLSTLLSETGFSAIPPPPPSLLDGFNFVVPTSTSPPPPLPSSPPPHSRHPFATSSPLIKTPSKKPTPLNFIDPSSFPLPPTSPPPLSSSSSSSQWTSPSSSYASPRTPSTPWRDQSDDETLRTPPSPSRDLFAERDFDEDEPTRLRSNASTSSKRSSSSSFHLPSFGLPNSPPPPPPPPNRPSLRSKHISTPPPSSKPHPFASQSSPSSSFSSNRGPSLNRPSSSPNPPTDFLPFRAAPSPPTSPTRTPSVRSSTSSKSSSSSRSSTSSRSSGRSLPKRGSLPGLFLDHGRENVGRAL
ncbi:hypothetical protein BDY24DRAFT_440048 [Mrakia frigida]|uniref:uncharacterized protein n=1 Tax=Mrakia frigida TaxID=29902 RepID=UPI003FCBF7E9